MIADKVEKSYDIIRKLEHSPAEKEFTDVWFYGKRINLAITVAKTKSTYKKLKKEELESILDYIGYVLEVLEEKIRRIKTEGYEAGGIEFLEGKQHVVVAYVNEKNNWREFINVVHVAFKKPILLMLIKSNVYEMEIKNKWNLNPTEVTDSFYKCIVTLEDIEKILNGE